MHRVKGGAYSGAHTWAWAGQIPAPSQECAELLKGIRMRKDSQVTVIKEQCRDDLDDIRSDVLLSDGLPVVDLKLPPVAGPQAHIRRAKSYVKSCDR